LKIKLYSDSPLIRSPFQKNKPVNSVTFSKFKRCNTLTLEDNDNNQETENNPTGNKRFFTS